METAADGCLHMMRGQRWTLTSGLQTTLDLGQSLSSPTSKLTARTARTAREPCRLGDQRSPRSLSSSSSWLPWGVELGPRLTPPTAWTSNVRFLESSPGLPSRLGVEDYQIPPTIQESLATLKAEEKSLEEQLEAVSVTHANLQQALQKADQKDTLWQARSREPQSQVKAAIEARQQLFENDLNEAMRKAEEDKATLTSSLQEQLDSLTARNEYLQQQLHEAKEHEQATEAENEMLRKELKKAQQEAKEKAALASALQETFVAERKEVQAEVALKEQLEGFNVVKLQLETLIVKLQEQFGEVGTRMEKEAESEPLKTELKHSQLKVEELTASYSASQAENQELKKKLEQAKQEAEELATSCSDLKALVNLDRHGTSASRWIGEYEVELDQRNGKRLGMELEAGGHMVIVTRVDSDSLVEEWNKSAEESQMVRTNYLIVEVNGIRGEASEMMVECEKDQVLRLKLLKVDGDPWRNRDYALARVSSDGDYLHRAPDDLLRDRELVLRAICLSEGPFDALEHCSPQLLHDPSFVEEAVRRSQAPWLLRLPQLKHFSEDKDLRQRCEAVAGTGLVFTWYRSATCFLKMRECFWATGASVPGGEAYKEVMKYLEERPGGAVNLWIEDTPVFGASADGGKWQHPPRPCGRDMKPVPAGRSGMWNCNVESRTGDHRPQVGSRHPCWCCRWLERVQQMHKEGYVICCVTSNIYDPEWVEKYGAGSSELSDDQAQRFGQPRERFRNGRPGKWGTGAIKITSMFGGKFNREAPVDQRTRLPLGQGCRWERQALDSLEFPVFVFFMP